MKTTQWLIPPTGILFSIKVLTADIGCLSYARTACKPTISDRHSAVVDVLDSINQIARMGSNEQPNRLLAYNIYVYRKPDMDEQSHHHHIEHVNSPIITSLLKKYGAVSYSVVRCLRM